MLIALVMKKAAKGTVVYGQGNSLFDNSVSEFWQTNSLVEPSVENDVMSTCHSLKSGIIRYT